MTECNVSAVADRQVISKDDLESALWAGQVLADMRVHDAAVVAEAIRVTADAVDKRSITRQQVALLKWYGYAFWALPRALSLLGKDVRLLDGMYFRTWVCELDGVTIDGHIGGVVCQVCGPTSCLP